MKKKAPQSVSRFSSPATTAEQLRKQPQGTLSLFVRSAMKGFARSKKCNPEFITTAPELNSRQVLTAEKFSFKADPEFIKSHKKIAARVVTDRPRGERFSRYVTASLVWALNK